MINQPCNQTISSFWCGRAPRVSKNNTYRSELLASGYQHLPMQQLVSLDLLQRLRLSWKVRQSIDGRQWVRHGVRHQWHRQHLSSCCTRCGGHRSRPALLLTGTHLDSGGGVGCRRQHAGTAYPTARQIQQHLNDNYTIIHSPIRL